MKSSWLQDRVRWLDAEGKPQKADGSRSERATEEADLAEADYVDAELAKIIDGQVMIGGKKIEIADITIDCDEQTLFTDEDVAKLMHPKLKRLLQAKLRRGGKDATSKKFGAVQKAVERERVQKVLTQVADSWREYLDANVLASSRAQILDQLQPGVTGHAKQKKEDLEEIGQI